MKKMFKSPSRKFFIGIGIFAILALFPFGLFSVIVNVVTPKEPHVFNKGDHYEVVTLGRTGEEDFDVLTFKVQSQVVDSLGFTENQISSSCSNLADRAIAVMSSPGSIRFKFKGEQEVRMVNGSPMVIVQGDIIDPRISKEEELTRFFVAKAGKDGKCGPYEYCYKEELESTLKNKSE